MIVNPSGEKNLINNKPNGLQEPAGPAKREAELGCPDQYFLHMYRHFSIVSEKSSLTIENYEEIL
jgi:hypothetical protein